MAVSQFKEAANCSDSYGSFTVIALIAMAVSGWKESANCSDSYGSIMVEGIG